MRQRWWIYPVVAACAALVVRGVQAVIEDGLWIWRW